MLHNEFREAGYRVFGLYGIDKKGKCKCGNKYCSAPGKHPISGGWQHTPDWSDDQWEVSHELGQFETGYGVLCKGLLVVDVDARNGGVESYSRLVKEVPEIAGAGLIVETGSGGGSKHLYFSLPADTALLQHLEKYPGIDFKSSGYVVGPGSIHASGNTYKAVVGSPYDIGEAPEALIELLKKPEHHRADYNGESVDVTEGELREMLKHIPNDCHYEEYIRVGMALHHVTGGLGFHLWDEWAQRSDKYTGRTIANRWHSFGKSSTPVTFGTLAHYAEQGGWQQSVTFVATEYYDYEPETDLLNVDDIDLKRPPGFVGEVTKWVNDQCLFPRENAAAAASVAAVGAICGLRYTDNRNITANMFTIIAAGSGTGKERILSSVDELYEAAGLGCSVHGKIKSEQEIVRNLLEFQSAHYLIDEIGIHLSKILNAKNSGAAYLEGVIAEMMAIYSKANGKYKVSGDVRRDMQETLRREISRLQNKVDDLEDPHGVYARELERKHEALVRTDAGIVKPYLTMIGFTTPTTFDKLVTYEQATNGFIARSLIVNEPNNNPLIKEDHECAPMPDTMRATLQALYYGGYYDSADHGRPTEYYDKRVEIPTEAAADELLKKISKRFYEIAEQESERTGLEAIPRRGFELTLKISLILAAPGGIRTVEHVRWAYKMALEDVKRKTRMTNANHKNSLRDRILALLDTDKGMSVALIYNKTPKEKRANIESELEAMTREGLAKKEKSARTVKYYKEMGV